MSADLSTFVELKGTKEELAAMLLAIIKFQKSSYAQYQKKHDCGYIEAPWVTASSRKKNIIDLCELSEEDIQKLVSKRKTVNVEISGPYGCFMEPREVPLFEAIADAAPKAEFQGGTSGFVTGARVNTSAILKNGKLTIEGFYIPDEAYEEYISGLLSYEEFCELFHIDEDSLDYDIYLDWIADGVIESTPFKKFLGFFNKNERPDLDEKQYLAATQKLADKKIKNKDEFENDPNSIYEYDPSTHEYTKIKDLFDDIYNQLEDD